MQRMIWGVIVGLCVVFASAACDMGHGDPGPPLGVELPDGADDAALAAPVDAGAVRVLVMVDLSVGNDFPGEHIEVAIDDETVVTGFGYARPSLHCNWYGPYVVDVGPGPHLVEAALGSGPLTMLDSFEVEELSTLFVSYTDPSFDADVSLPRLTSHVFSGPPGCA